MPSPIRDNPGPGEYTNEPRRHVVAPDMGRSKGRPDPAINPDNDGNLGPGSYEPPEPQVKTFTFHPARQESPDANRRGYAEGGPGQYDPDRAEGMTKPKVPQPIISKAPRANNFVGDDALGPGVYDKHDEFGKGVKTFTFPPSPSKQADRTGKDGLGPGSYDPEQADRMTKPNNGIGSFANQTGRGGLMDGRETGCGAEPGTGDKDRWYEYPKIVDSP